MKRHLIFLLLFATFGAFPANGKPNVLLGKRQSGRQTANSERAGDKALHRAEFRGGDSAGSVVPASAQGAGAGLRSTGRLPRPPGAEKPGLTNSVTDF